MSDFWRDCWWVAAFVCAGVIAGLVLAFLLAGCAPHWCRTDPIPVEIVGKAQIRHCDRDACMDRCGYPPTPQCEDACDIACIAVDGEWIVDDAWLVEQARALYDCAGE